MAPISQLRNLIKRRTKGATNQGAIVGIVVGLLVFGLLLFYWASRSSRRHGQFLASEGSSASSVEAPPPPRKPQKFRKNAIPKSDGTVLDDFLRTSESHVLPQAFGTVPHSGSMPLNESVRPILDDRPSRKAKRIHRTYGQPAVPEARLTPPERASTLR